MVSSKLIPLLRFFRRTSLNPLDNNPITVNFIPMNISLAIERHRKPLLRIVATLFAMIGLAEGASVERLSSPVYRAVLRLLRPAESAVRRLIVVAARSLTLKPPQARSTARAAPRAARKHHNRATFKLFDPRQRFGSAFGHERSAAIAPDWCRGRNPAFASSMSALIRACLCSSGRRQQLCKRLRQFPWPMARSTQSVSAAALPPSNQRLKTCRARPCAIGAGKPSHMMPAVRNLLPRFVPEHRRAIAKIPSTRSMRFWPNAIGWPGIHRRPIHLEAAAPEQAINTTLVIG